MKDKFNKFYKKTLEERRQILKELNILNDQVFLAEEIGDTMIENYVLNMEIPLGLAMNFSINAKDYIIPMAIEEPSVIAAASNGAKTLGNIETTMNKKYLIGQVVLENVKNPDAAIKILEENKDNLMDLAEEHSQSMIKRGGGPKEITFKKFDQGFVCIYISVDTCDAMGANTINTILEALAPLAEELTDSIALLRILSNHATESVVVAETKTPVQKLNKDIEKARQVARRIEAATKYANIDPYRAVTHNKGIMNGVDAVVLATGNDFRAVEAGVHAYTVRDGQYKSLTSWTFDEENDLLLGRIEIPMAVATLGGTISINPIAKWSLEVLGNPDAKDLAKIIAAVGLVQNFSALRALVTDGIQKGHMSLHAKTLAKQIEVKEEEMDEFMDSLLKADKVNLSIAKEILAKMRGEL